MASLGKQDFFDGSDPKTAGAGKYAGQSREQIVLSKIKAKDVFIIGKDASGKKIFGSSLDTSDWPYKLSYGEGNTIPVTKLFKDPDFGGGAGSGGGADDTKYTESGQCYFTSLVFNVIKKELKQSDCTFENLQKAAQYVDATISLDDFWIKGPVNWNEEDTYRRSANLIYKDYKSKFKTPVYCHRGSKFMDDIYKAKGKVMKTDMFSAPGSFSNDKWNPGDIWLSSFPMSSQPLAESITWAEMNQKVLEYAGATTSVKTTKLLGVSLKKLAPSGGKVDSYNLAKRKHNVSVQFKSFKFGKTGDFFSSMDIYLKFSVAEVQLRAFNTTSAWQGEIKGAIAAGGKIGGGNLNYYLEKHAMKSIGYPNENSKKGVAWKEMKYTEVNMTKMYDLYVKFNGLQTGKILPIVSYAEFITRANKKGKGFIFSKNMCLMFMNTFMDSTPVIRNKISTEIVRYAASNTDISSFFIKVY
jgi:hypothetical protein|tara:strand:- start:47 stop:1453 length:1407 start_codon:yes stop_codon:yes gene_type:complete